MHDFVVALTAFILPLAVLTEFCPAVLGFNFMDNPQVSGFAIGVAGFASLVGAACAGVYRNFSAASLRVQDEQIKLAVASEKQRADRWEMEAFGLKAENGIIRGELLACKRELELRSMEIDRLRGQKTS